MTRSPSRRSTTTTTVAAASTTTTSRSSSSRRRSKPSAARKNKKSKNNTKLSSSSSNKRVHWGIWGHLSRKEREDAVWEQRFQELAAFQQTHGHCNTPFPNRPHQSQQMFQLSTWVVEQRRRRRQDKMPAERFRRLQELGFDWDRRASRPDELWFIMYARMQAYQTRVGNCLVPLEYQADPKLGRWVSLQVRF